MCCITVLSAIAAINQAVETGNVNTVFEKLSNPEACIENIDEGCKEKYQEALAQAKAVKQKVKIINVLSLLGLLTSNWIFLELKWHFT